MAAPLLAVRPSVRVRAALFDQISIFKGVQARRRALFARAAPSPPATARPSCTRGQGSRSRSSPIAYRPPRRSPTSSANGSTATRLISSPSRSRSGRRAGSRALSTPSTVSAASSSTPGSASAATTQLSPPLTPTSESASSSTSSAPRDRRTGASSRGSQRRSVPRRRRARRMYHVYHYVERAAFGTSRGRSERCTARLGQLKVPQIFRAHTSARAREGPCNGPTRPPLQS